MRSLRMETFSVSPKLFPPDTGSTGATPMALALIATLLLFGCSGPPRAEASEARGMARLFTRMTPEAEELEIGETRIASELLLIIEEAGSDSVVAKYGEQFHAAVEKLGIIRARRVALQQKVRQGVATTPLVNAVQEDAIHFFGEQINRGTVWLQLSANIRLRHELEREKNLPEMERLQQTLERFAAELHDSPLSSQIQILQAEYGFSDEEIGR
ncbi:MAG TPA: hypothetical protein VNH18_08665 [Bryobacteraceae bacterium]|nr:hypothetical protein [Bryobacteraceae bacterium]